MSLAVAWPLARRSIFFWMGLLFSAFGILFTGIALQGVQRETLYRQEGEVVEGTVLTKTVRHAVRGENSRTRYMVNYQFRAEDGALREGLQEVSVEEWEGLHDGQPFRVRYLRDDPATSRSAEDSDWTDPYAFGGFGVIFGTIGGVLLIHRLLRIRLTVRLLREGVATEGTVVRVSPANVAINGVPQREIHYCFTDQVGQRHDGCSEYLAPAEAARWKKGDKGTVRYDRQEASRNIWLGKA